MQTFYRQQNTRDNVYSNVMKRLLRFWKIVVLDVLGVALMILAVLTGWLPGPGGIPLFIIGLSLLAINHEWAERYIDLLKNRALSSLTTYSLFLLSLQEFYCC
jgi:membrane-bound ClpP family serine protease